MKKQLFTILALSCSIAGFSQSVAPQVIASSGGNGSSTQAQLSWTVGETVTPTLTGSNNILTQGFQQTYLTVTALEDKTDLNLSMTAYPNPTADFVTINAGTQNLENLSYTLFDSNGKLLAKQTLVKSQTEVSLTSYASGVYFLKVTNKQEKGQNFKIVKQN